MMLTVDDEQVPLPRTVAPESRLTVAADSQLIVKAGVVVLVMLSVDDVPKSDAA